MLVSGEEANNLPGLHCGYGGWVGVDTYQWQHLWRGHVQVISVALFCFALLMLFLLCQQWVRPWSDLPYCHPWDSEGDEARRLPALDHARGLPAEKSEVPCSSEMKEMAMGRRIPSCALISGLLWWTPRSLTWRALGRRRWLLGLLSLKTLSLIILEGESDWCVKYLHTTIFRFYMMRKAPAVHPAMSEHYNVWAGLQPLLLQRNNAIPQ